MPHVYMMNSLENPYANAIKNMMAMGKVANWHLNVNKMKTVPKMLTVQMVCAFAMKAMNVTSPICK